MELFFYFCIAGVVVFQIAALFVWAIRIHRYVESHGEKTAFFLYNMASLLDYRSARRISERSGVRPRFLAWYERFQIASVSCFIVGVVALLIWQLR
jgi:hypothetical protein